MDRDRASWSDSDGLARKLYRPWSFATQSTAQSDGMEIPLIESESRKSRSTSAWFQYPASLRRRFEATPALTRPGWWQDQMLFDRSLRSMAILMTFYATILTVVCIAYSKDFKHRGNPHSTSVGSKTGRSCKSLQGIDIVCNMVCASLLG